MRFAPFVVALAVTACHAHPRDEPPVPPADQRVAAIMAAWGRALERDDDAALAETEDRGGRFALVYTAVKVAASPVPGGAKAVETTVAGNLIIGALQSMWPGLFGAPTDSFFIVVPTGPLGPALAAAGLVEPLGTEPFSVVAVSKDATFGRLKQASEHHRARLRDGQAWTCTPVAIEKTILPTEPSLVHAATISTTILASWLHSVDAIWLVRATCATGPGLFVITGGHAPDGSVADRILVATLASEPDQGG